MNNGGIDASLGLEVVLTTLRRLRKHGILQADVSHVPGIQGRCRCAITLAEGNIISCVATNEQGQQFSLKVDVLVTLDRKKGPFTWSFHPQAAQRPPQQSSPSLPGIPYTQMSPAQQPGPPYTQMSPAQRSLQPYSQMSPAQQQRPYPHALYPVSPRTVPIPLAKLDLVWLNTLSSNEKVAIGWIFSLIDGQRTASEIASLLPRLKIEDVIKGLQLLQRMNTITFVER